MKVYEQPVSSVRAPLRPMANGVSRAQVIAKGAKGVTGDFLTKADVESMVSLQPHSIIASALASFAESWLIIISSLHP